MFDLDKLTRENIKSLKPYSSAREEFKGRDKEDYIFLDANENFASPVHEKAFNRYPDPKQIKIRSKLASLKSLKDDQVFLGNGSDEVVDLLIRLFCVPGSDKILICPPTYGMYQVSADINDIQVCKASLKINLDSFRLDLTELKNTIEREGDRLKIIFLCSPNNPTGECLEETDVIDLLNNFNGILFVDEAYIDFSPDKSLLPLLKDYPNLVISSTFSKAWGLAGLRLGTLFASSSIVSLLDKIKPPYNVNSSTAEICLEALENQSNLEESISLITKERSLLVGNLSKLNCVKKVFPSDANFLLVEFLDSKRVFNYLIENKIVVRDRSSQTLCENCLRLTIGSPDENEQLVKVLSRYNP